MNKAINFYDVIKYISNKTKITIDKIFENDAKKGKTKRLTVFFLHENKENNITFLFENKNNELIYKKIEDKKEEIHDKIHRSINFIGEDFKFYFDKKEEKASLKEFIKNIEVSGYRVIEEKTLKKEALFFKRILLFLENRLTYDKQVIFITGEFNNFRIEKNKKSNIIKDIDYETKFEYDL